jgi:hypothetical protein
MNEQEHTPGPWTCRVAEGAIAVTHWIDADGALPVADVKVQSASVANARLIAASPDLLEALRFLLAAAETYPDMAIFKAHLALARAAIAKAAQP